MSKTVVEEKAGYKEIGTGIFVPEENGAVALRISV